MSLLLREAIGGSIRRARTERRRTLRDVSHSARVSLGYLSEIERGRKEPSSELLAAICEALALPLPDLLDDVANAFRPAAARRMAVVDPALRSAVEEAFEPVHDEAPAGEAPAPTSASTSGSEGHTAASTSTGASACATLPTPPAPEEPAEPSTVALPEPEGTELPERVDAAAGVFPVRLVGVIASSAPVRVAA